MDLFERVKQIAVGTLNNAILVAPEHGVFRMMVTFKADDGDKPLLMIGTAHGKFEDGHCYAILNPDRSLCEELVAGCGYDSIRLKERVAKRCDLALDVWNDAYRENGVSVTTKYKARSFQPAKFLVS